MPRAFAEIDAAAITANTRSLAHRAGSSGVCAVVKANGYGHGAEVAAAAAIAGGAGRLGVAQVQEGIQLREAGFDEPIWLFSEPDPPEFVDCAEFALEPPVYSERGFDAATSVAGLTVHLALDTGMHRIGCSPASAPRWAVRISSAPGLTLGSVWTHLAVADEPGNPYTDAQLDRFESVLEEIAAVGVDVEMTHAANSAATIAVPRAHRDVVRPGVALYGMPPSPALDGMIELWPAMKLWTTVAFVKRLQAGDRVSYGLRTRLSAPANIATLPVGYADGVRRGWWENGVVLIHGRRCPIVGVITMDQMMIDCGDLDVAPGDEAVLIGRQGSEKITAGEMAAVLHTINYEITCAVSPRVGRIPATSGQVT
jgi:alanine racemase